MRIDMRLRCYLFILLLAVNNWLLAAGNRKKTICNFTDQSICSVSGESRVSGQSGVSRLSGQTRISRQIRLSGQNGVS